jgi:hypothetical protein
LVLLSKATGVVSLKGVLWNVVEIHDGAFASPTGPRVSTVLRRWMPEPKNAEESTLV